MSEDAGGVERRRIAIRTIRHIETGLLAAMSDDMKGLYVHARSEAELWERIAIASRSILEADGYDVARSSIVTSKSPRSAGHSDPP
jgi:hypothetical protein